MYFVFSSPFSGAPFACSASVHIVARHSAVHWFSGLAKGPFTRIQSERTSGALPYALQASTQGGASALLQDWADFALVESPPVSSAHSPKGSEKLIGSPSS